MSACGSSLTASFLVTDVNTDMTKGKGIKTLDQGAETPVLVALQETKGISGEFWSEKKVAQWHSQ